jgi:chromate transporter
MSTDIEPGGPATRAHEGSVSEVARVFLRLGLTTFGGPAAHIAAMEDELVQRRGWVTRSEFLDLVSAANLVPGPNSTELAIHLGFRRAGWPGLAVAGLMFLAPAVIIVWVMAALYQQYGQRPEVGAILTGMQPVVLAVVMQALWRLGSAVLRAPVAFGIALISTMAVVSGANELLVLGAAAMAGLLVSSKARTEKAQLITPSSALGAGALASTSVTPLLLATAPTTLGVFGSFLKIGSVLFGSGYVLLAFLRAEFVERHAWLTEAQLLDAIAVGQVTPGPLFSSATFIGYLLAGHAGALVATIGIFLPAFVFVAVSGPLVRRIRQSPRASAALDGVNAASLALMAGTLVFMVRPMATSPFALGIFLASAALLIRTRVGAGWMLLAGAAIGLLYAQLA